MKNVELKDKIVSWIKDYYQTNNLKGAIINISGGKDSGVVAGLMAEAIGGENIIGLALPCHSRDDDALDAQLVADKFGFELLKIDLTNVYDEFVGNIDKLGVFSEDEKSDSNINFKPRLRMSTAYYMAALMSKVKHGTYIVPGTSNACELYVGYFTKGGDSVFDIAPIYNLTVDEVIAVGEALAVPEKVLYKTPDDGLSGKSDEDKLGVKYKDIAAVIKGEPVDDEVREKIELLNKKTRHKFVKNDFKFER